MLHHIKLLILFILYLTLNLFPQAIRNIEVSGNNYFSTSEIIGWSGISAGQNIFPGIIDSVNSRLAYNFAATGYYHSVFNTEIHFQPDSQTVSLNISLTENDPTFISQIIFINAASVDSSSMISEFQFLEGAVFNKPDIEKSISSALEYYENNGNPFAEIVISKINFYTGTENGKYYADIYLKLGKGRISRIDKIKINGSTKTKDKVVLRELRINPGEIYSQKLIEEIPYRLNRLGFFNSVNLPDYSINADGEGVLTIDIHDKQTNNFDGIIGFNPGNSQSESGYFTGLVNISLRNLFGTGRAAAIRWQKLDRSSQELELKYLEPWLFNFPLNVEAGLFQRNQDTIYVQRRLNFSISYLATEDISAAFIFSTESVIPGDNDTLTFTVYNSTSITTGLNLKIDSRDDPYAPTKGILFINAYSFSQKKINGPEKFISPGFATNINLQRFELEFRIFYQPFQRQVIALGLYGKELRGNFFDQSDLYRLGGTNSLRGYRQDQFLGSRIFWSNLEYRFSLTRRSFTFLFIDTGYFFLDGDKFRNIARSEAFKIGYGLGINLETGLGVIGVSFALAKGDGFSDGKIHFGIVNEF